MGTTYQLTYTATGRPAVQESQAVEELLQAINASLSTYLETSVISRINASADTAVWHPVDVHFERVFLRALEIHRETGGAFNPAVGPLVEAWGFGPAGERETPTAATVRDLMRTVSFDAFQLRTSPPSVQKGIAAARLDFNALAEGYAIDAIAALLEQRGVTNYLIELGGEVRARGQSQEGRAWTVGIERPAAEPQAEPTVQATVELKDSALATSGNYRNYRVENGQKLPHIVDPRTGYPESSSLLSVSVVAADAITADAYATAFMVMGPEQTLRFLETRSDLHAYLISSDAAGNIVATPSPGFPKTE
jgi:thiamine biosynthesis lipoprotein